MLGMTDFLDGMPTDLKRIRNLGEGVVEVLPFAQDDNIG